MEHNTGAVESLAVYLSRVRPGQQCPCCGAALQSVDDGPRLGRSSGGRTSLIGSAGRPAVRAQQALECPNCGCEIGEDSAVESEAHLRELHTAA